MREDLTMPKLNTHDAPDALTLDGYEGHFGELGEFTVGFETYTADADLADLFKGLPDDRCQCPHWGVVLKGKLTSPTTGARPSSRPARPTTSARPPPVPVRRDRGHRVQPDRGAAETLEVVEKNMAEQG